MGALPIIHLFGFPNDLLLPAYTNDWVYSAVIVLVVASSAIYYDRRFSAGILAWAIAYSALTYFFALGKPMVTPMHVHSQASIEWLLWTGLGSIFFVLGNTVKKSDIDSSDGIFYMVIAFVTMWLGIYTLVYVVCALLVVFIATKVRYG